MHRRALLLAFGSAPMLGGQTAARPAPLIAAAASLQPALEEAAALIMAETGIALRFAYGASGNLARQIAQGAPFEMLIAADEISVRKLAEAGQLRDAGHVFALGRLALFAPRGSALDPAAGLEALRPLLAAGRVQRFAIANPEIAPFGRAAEEALRQLDLWEALRPRLVFGENIAQAAQFAMMEGATGGLIAHSLVLSPALTARGSFSLVPSALHGPLRHSLAVTKRGGDAALRVQAWLLSPGATAVFARHGLEAP
ncbi:MAG: molybdate ABC transporter substrate-binding protein [Alphaproteobacteria bacterium]|jgi:molybdate transport system substrate-binding protein